MNALRDIPTAKEIDVRLQTNEVLVHLPEDTALGAVNEGIHEAGYKSDTNLWLTAEGEWTASGFLPEGWENSIPAGSVEGKAAGFWELHFEKKDGQWQFRQAKSIGKVPQIKDESR